MAYHCGRIMSSALHGIDGIPVSIEVTVLPGLPAFNIVGLGDSAVREARDRVYASLKNNGYNFPHGRITASYAPAWRHKAGSAFDLPLALALLIATGQISEPASKFCAFGELGLTGEVRGVPGVICRMSVCEKFPDLYAMVPAANSCEARAAAPDKIISVNHLNQAVEIIRRNQWQNAYKSDNPAQIAKKSTFCDLVILGGQEKAMRALLIAAAGRHNILLLGSPGCGKSTLARQLAGILPEMNEREALATTRIHSAAGQLEAGSGLVAARPFRSPHHSIGRAALMGGGQVPGPGEASLAHNGVLFLDEITEFRAEALDSLRQPLEGHCVRINRLHNHYDYPADFILVGAANPCRCGEYYEPTSACRCTEEQVRRHIGKISGPLLDRIDMVVEMTRLDPDVLPDSIGRQKSSLDIGNMRKIISDCWDIQAGRCRRKNRQIECNGRINGREMADVLEIPAKVADTAALIAAKLSLSVRGYQKLLRLARTVADLNGNDQVSEDDLAEACQYRIRFVQEIVT